VADGRGGSERDAFRGVLYLALVPLALGTYLLFRICVPGALGVVLAVFLTVLVVWLLLRKARGAR